MLADLQERLGGGWVVEEMIHDPDRHPCELVETVGGVDVLLTAHGFQVRVAASMDCHRSRTEEEKFLFRGTWLFVLGCLLSDGFVTVWSTNGTVLSVHGVGKCTSAARTESIILPVSQQYPLSPSFLTFLSPPLTLSHCDNGNNKHNYQSMLGLFMRPGALLFEVYPHKYFKAGYAPMAEGLGVRHAYSMSRSLRPLIGLAHPSTETCMDWHLCRSYARSSDVELDRESLDRLVELALLPPSSDRPSSRS